MDAYIVIGNANTRKASVLRSLTGCFNRSVREILPLDAAAPLRLYARVGSLQDTRTTPAEAALTWAIVLGLDGRLSQEAEEAE